MPIQITWSSLGVAAAVLLLTGCAAPVVKFTPAPAGTVAIRLDEAQTRTLDVFPSLVGYANPPTVTFPPGEYRPDAQYTAPNNPHKRGILYKPPGMLVTKGVPDSFAGERLHRGWLYINKEGEEWVGAMIEGYQAGWWEDRPPNGLKGEPIKYRIVEQ